MDTLSVLVIPLNAVEMSINCLISSLWGRLIRLLLQWFTKVTYGAFGAFSPIDFDLLNRRPWLNNWLVNWWWVEYVLLGLQITVRATLYGVVTDDVLQRLRVDSQRSLVRSSANSVSAWLHYKTPAVVRFCCGDDELTMEKRKSVALRKSIFFFNLLVYWWTCVLVMLPVYSLQFGPLVKQWRNLHWNGLISAVEMWLLERRKYPLSVRLLRSGKTALSIVTGRWSLDQPDGMRVPKNEIHENHLLRNPPLYIYI